MLDITQWTMFPKIILGIAIIVGIAGVCLSRKQKIVVYANYTDLLMTFVSIMIPCICWMICNNYDLSNTYKSLIVGLTAFMTVYCVIRSTYLYNQSVDVSFFGFVLSLYTKYFILTVICVVFLMCIIYSFGTKWVNPRRSGESKSSYNNRIRRESRDADNTSKEVLLGLFGFLVFVGLWEPKTVSLSSYYHGYWSNTESSDYQNE